jgi:hypothetical protein
MGLNKVLEYIVGCAGVLTALAALVAGIIRVRFRVEIDHAEQRRTAAKIKRIEHQKRGGDESSEPKREHAAVGG